MTIRSRLQTKLGSALALLILLVTLGVGYLVVQRERETQLRALEQRADRLVLLFSQTLDLPLWNADRTAIEQQFTALALDPEVAQVTVRSLEFGTVAELRKPASEPLLDPVARQKAITYAPDYGGNAKPIGDVRIVLTRAAVEESIRSSVTAIMVLLLALMAALYAGSYGLVRRMVISPLQRLGAMVDRIAEGDLQARCVVASSDELGHLAARVNTMAQRLQHSLEAQREAALHTQAMLDNVGDAVVTFDDQGLIESFNLAACTLFGYSPSEAVGRHVAMLMPASEWEDLAACMTLQRGTEEAGRRRELQGLRRDATPFPMTLKVSRLQRLARTTFIALMADISAQRQAQEAIHRLAYYDTVTELPNRRLLLDRLRHALVSAGRTGQPGALVFMDLDHFKQVNDQLGHAAGDALLRQVADRLRGSVREADTVARVGGDEFVLLLESLGTSEQEAAAHAALVARKLLDALGQPYPIDGHAVACTPSLGIAIVGTGAGDMETLLKQADAAMYQAKALGRNRCCFFDAATQAALNEHTALIDALRQGLDKGEFLLHYQLQVDAEGRPIGAEALLRWNQPTRGMVSPADFIPLAEESGLILPLGRWVLGAACAQLRAWAQDQARQHWTMAVNVSSLQLAQTDFVDTVLQALHVSGADPHRLKLELTESALLDNIEKVVEKMHALRAMGINFSLDDFGTGYSSLSYLRSLPLAQLKIDKSFVNALLSDHNAAVIAYAVVSLGKSLGLQVIAEGVETAAQRDALAEMGYQAFQGYHFGRPGPAEALGC